MQKPPFALYYGTIMQKMKKIVSFFKKPWRAIAMLVVVIIVGFFLFRGSGNKTPNLITVARGTVTQEVIVTGQITPEQNVDLAFQTPGTISRVYVKVGDKVDVGTPLLTLDSSELQAQLASAKAAVDTQQANLDLLNQGARPEDIQISEAQVTNAQGALTSAQRSAISALQGAVTNADDAVHNRADQLFNNPSTSNPQLAFTLNDAQLVNNLELERVKIQNTLGPWETLVNGLTTTSDLHTAIQTSNDVLSKVRQLLSDLSLALSEASMQNTASQSSISTWQASIVTGRTNVSTSITSVSSAQGSLISAETALKVAQDQLALKQAPPTPEQVAAQQAQVEQAQAQVSLIQAQIGKTVLRSPLKGVVTREDGKMGESVLTSNSLVSIIGENSLEIEANVPEVDIAKIQTGDPVQFTLDAIQGETFSAHIVEVDPAETVIDGVSNYKIKAAFDSQDPRFKSGLTANLSIETLKKENVLMLPQFAITQNDSGTFVTELKGTNEVQVPVTLGITGQDGNVEITSGVQEGDKVLNVGLKSS